MQTPRTTETLPGGAVRTEADLRLAIDTLIAKVPTVLCGLNVGQYRNIRGAYTRNAENLIPRTALITPANGWGKTQLLAQDIVGWTKGRDFLKDVQIDALLRKIGLGDRFPGHPFPEEALAYYDTAKPLRDAGTLSLRLVCDAEDTKEGGSLHKALKEWIPDCVFCAQDNAKCYRQVEIPHPTIPGVRAVIAIKTFDQEPRKHSGSNVHRVWVNEPMPQLIWGETAARTRSKRGEQVGSILFCATVLNQAPYVSEVLENPRTFHGQGVIWENCDGAEVTDADAEECREQTGIELQKNPDGPGYLTHGFLARQSIVDMIEDWKTGSPDELEARKFGKFMHLSGRVFKQPDRDVHVVPDALYSVIPTNYPVFQVVDPHPRKPDFSAWFILTPGNRLVAIAEHPGYPLLYENLKSRDLNIDQTCEAWRRIEGELGITAQVVARIGDPNRFLCTDSRDNQSLKYLYGLRGFNFETNVSDNLDLGYREMNRYFYFDKHRYSVDHHDPAAIPLILFLEKCVNLWRCVVKHSWKEKRDSNAAVSDQIEEKFKHGIDLIRYLVMWLKDKTFDDMKVDKTRVTDYDRIKMGRLPMRSVSTNPWKKPSAGRSLVYGTFSRRSRW